VIEKTADPKNLQVLTISELGLGKKTNLSEYKIQGRGGSGIKTMNITKKTGQIKVMYIADRGIDADIVVISKTGQTIRTGMAQISTLGRSTQGVRIMRLGAGDTVASATIV
jgi:DNA gyrase subunit A